MQVWISQPDVVKELEDLGIDTAQWTSDSYAKLNAEILKQQRMFERLTRRKYERATITEKLNGSGKDTIILRYFPVVSIGSIVIEDVPGYPYTLLLTEYRLDEETGVLSLIRTYPLMIANFAQGKLNIVATYTFGYLVADIPEDIQDALLYMTLIGVIMRTPGDWEKLGLKSIRIAQYAESYGAGKGMASGIFAPQKDYWAQTIDSTIARYKRMPVV